MRWTPPWMLLWPVLLGCPGPSAEVIRARAAVQAAVTLPLPVRGDGEPTWSGPAQARDGVTARALALPLDQGPDPFLVAMILLEPERPTGAGVAVAHGHYGGGKNDPNAWELAWRLARRGARVAVVDGPGVEEWQVPGRLLHFEAGAHGRAYLAAAGTSALALQVAVLRRGVDLLVAAGATHIAATGASGGAVLSWYLAHTDPRVAAVVLASAPPIPREARAAGCPCDQLPGWPGPDPTVLASLDRPLLWMSDRPQPRPAGLPRGARFEVWEGEHAYTEAMQGAALAFLDDHLPLRSADESGPVPALDLHTPGAAAAPDAPGIFDLPLAPPARAWQPQPDPDAPYEVDCTGEGPVVLAAGADEEDLAALRGAGLAPCAVSVPEDVVALAEAISRSGAAADRPAGALVRAARQRGAVGVYAVRGWSLPGAATGLPLVVRQPVRRPAEVDLARDPPWIHVPGAWWGVAEATLATARATGEDRQALAAALAAALPAAPAPASP